MKETKLDVAAANKNNVSAFYEVKVARSCEISRTVITVRLALSREKDLRDQMDWAEELASKFERMSREISNFK